MLPGDPACRELTPEEAAELARAWTNLLEDDARDGGNARRPLPALRPRWHASRARIVDEPEPGSNPARGDARAVRALVRVRQVHRHARG